MTGDLVKAMMQTACPIVVAIDGICVGAGAIMAMASDLRIATPEAKTAFLFNRVGLGGVQNPVYLSGRKIHRRAETLDADTFDQGREVLKAVRLEAFR